MSENITDRQKRRENRKRRVRARIMGRADRPRLSVKRSLSSISAQLIDDTRGITLAHASDLGELRKGKPVERARLVGEELGRRALSLGIVVMVVDRGPYQYHGRLRALVEGCVASGVHITPLADGPVASEGAGKK
jgi:large subunit ribosomal protein L18